MDAIALASFNEELVKNPAVRNCNLRAEIIDGKLAVIGKVRSYYLKQVALHLARQWAPNTFILTTEIVVE